MPRAKSARARRGSGFDTFFSFSSSAPRRRRFLLLPSRRPGQRQAHLLVDVLGPQVETLGRRGEELLEQLAAALAEEPPLFRPLPPLESF